MKRTTSVKSHSPTGSMRALATLVVDVQKSDGGVPDGGADGYCQINAASVFNGRSTGGGAKNRLRALNGLGPNQRSARSAMGTSRAANFDSRSAAAKAAVARRLYASTRV